MLYTCTNTATLLKLSEKSAGVCTLHIVKTWRRGPGNSVLILCVSVCTPGYFWSLPDYVLYYSYCECYRRHVCTCSLAIINLIEQNGCRARATTPSYLGRQKSLSVKGISDGQQMAIQNSSHTLHFRKAAAAAGTVRTAHTPRSACRRLPLPH